MPAEASSAGESNQNLIRQPSTDSAMASIRVATPRLLQRVQQGISKFELIYTPHPRWPLPHPSLGPTAAKTPVRISILDSSFNPPTLAHLGLANSLPPDAASNLDSDYSAKLLLLSVKNADKTLKPGDARYEQRLEMMHLMVRSMEPLRGEAVAQLGPEEAANAAIAIIDEPTFVGKSRVLREGFAKRLADTPAPAINIADVELTFLVGHDTLARLVSPRYYPSEATMLAALRRFLSADAAGGDRSRVVSAQRSSPTGGGGGGAVDVVEELPYVREFLDARRITVIDMGDTLRTYSSTTVRRAVGSMGQDDGTAGSWRRLVTADVARYVVEEGLYAPEL
ncbi:hypothetical protein HYPSUDRAFT_44298 [Hypholoma sublateritium FD-334 SS-4]|uniref:Nicotinamide-nucleotide adenylyltransferase n=1 Tax=Hypholoma sublateritium (strain FD-334 SS-4) TaxID=945553 RepID=A0A0D2PHH4_HYPSF|nr:hypothetical protein HYPSUDRAFT_44298 [Hypholoma sublateritium FD-334 SS-4]